MAQREIPTTMNATIWRHGYSCANVLVASYNSIDHSEPDPALTIWGILSCLYQSQTYKPKYQISNCENQMYVHTSVLLRTWLTAILLYGPHYNELHLIISPFLKEVGDSTPSWYKPNENNPMPLELQMRSVLHSLNSIIHIQKYLSKHDNEYAQLLLSAIEKIKDTIIILHFPPKLASADKIYNYTTLFTSSIVKITIRYDGNSWNSDILNFDYSRISQFEDLYIENVTNHFLYAEDQSDDSQSEKIIPCNDGTIHSLSQPWGDLSLPRKLRSKTGEHTVEKRQSHQLSSIQIENVSVNADDFIGNGDIHKFFGTIISALNNYDKNTHNYYPKKYLDCLFNDFRVNVVCHGNIMKEFSKKQYNVENPRYIPFVQYTGTSVYSDAVSGNNWGMELNINIQQNGNKYNMVYPKVIKYYEGMINYIGDIYNIDCDMNCMTKKNATKEDAYYKNKYEKQKACKSCRFPDFDKDINLKELYLLSKAKQSAGYSRNKSRRINNKNKSKRINNKNKSRRINRN